MERQFSHNPLFGGRDQLSDAICIMKGERKPYRATRHLKVHTSSICYSGEVYRTARTHKNLSLSLLQQHQPAQTFCTERLCTCNSSDETFQHGRFDVFPLGISHSIVRELKSAAHIEDVFLAFDTGRTGGMCMSVFTIFVSEYQMALTEFLYHYCDDFAATPLVSALQCGCFSNNAGTGIVNYKALSCPVLLYW